ncbi:hypothetical protein CC86DRAFT_403642 [Ophiobolus disseminans]|uniref:Tat pathway signal sequence n=1 Tax=Ophiobolus disseminans TaxID=1469910 RepID=A0A6A7A6S2_9PLEO|nr:hypothetical protein CC86DRAFT_403642 [Ophiobolus disseminans]
MHSAYTGWPNDSNNRAWEELIRPVVFNATAEEMILAGEPLDDSVRLPAGGYLGSLGVYHELHCLRRIRLWLHRDTYYPNATRDDELFMQVHIGHCIEVLRLSAMCTADLGLYSFFWSSSDALKPTARSSAPRKCKRWSQIDDWTRERMLPNTHAPLLKGD